MHISPSLSHTEVCFYEKQWEDNHNVSYLVHCNLNNTVSNMSITNTCIMLLKIYLVNISIPVVIRQLLSDRDGLLCANDHMRHFHPQGLIPYMYMLAVAVRLTAVVQ